MNFVKRRMAIFKTGVHTDSAGRQKEWTSDDLARIAGAYDPTVHEAPVVIGHPQDNSPAFGWVKNVYTDGDVLWADAEIVPELDELVANGYYKKRSISLYDDGTLRHVGFLGAMPPAVKGLPDISFRDAQREHSEISMDDQIHKKEASTMKFFDFLKTLAHKDGITIEDFPQTFSEDERREMIDAEVTAKLEAEKARMASEFAEEQKRRTAELDAREAAIRKAEAEARRKSIATFCEDLGKKGILTPAMMKHGMGLTTFLEHISQTSAPIEFQEGTDTKSQTLLEFMLTFLAALPKAVVLGEWARADKDGGLSGDAAAQLDALIREKMNANEKLTYNEAFAEVQREHPEIAAEYAATVQSV